MKLKLCVLFIVATCLSATGATILTNNLGSLSKHFVSIAYQENQLSPLYIRGEKLPPDPDLGVGYPGAVIWYTVEYQTAIPSILLGEEKEYVGPVKGLVSISEEDVEGFEWVYEEGWLNTKLLGWVVANLYPFVYSADLGWIYVHERDSNNYGIYVYEESSRKVLDLEYYWDSRYLIRTNP